MKGRVTPSFFFLYLLPFATSGFLPFVTANLPLIKKIIIILANCLTELLLLLLLLLR